MAGLIAAPAARKSSFIITLWSDATRSVEGGLRFRLI